jgi:hypothetical protein
MFMSKKRPRFQAVLSLIVHFENRFRSENATNIPRAAQIFLPVHD